MKKLLALIGIVGLAALSFLAMGMSPAAAEKRAWFHEGYDYNHPEAEAPVGCVDCKREHLYHVVGLDPDTEEVTGDGWLASAHAMSFNKGVNNNTYCAWCHEPTGPGVTNQPNDATLRREGTWHGVTCAACHTTHSIAALYGTRYTTLIPGGDLEEAESYIGRHAEKGKQANKQCMTCHRVYHGFASRVKTAMFKSGSLRCMDCHFAGYAVTSRGTVERFHDAWVAANLPWSCNGKFGALVTCHSTAKKNWWIYVIPKIFQHGKGLVVHH